MVASIAPEPVKHPRRDPKLGGQLPAIRDDMVCRIAERVGQGLSLTNALYLEDPPQTLEHWNKVMDGSTRLSRMYGQKVAAYVYGLVKDIRNDPKQWQRIAWILERCFGETYAQNKSGRGLTVNVQTVIGLQEDVLSRSRAFVSRTERKAKVLDTGQVSSSNVSSSVDSAD